MGKTIKKLIWKSIIPRGLDARNEEFQEKHRQAITDRVNQIKALELTNEAHQQKMLRLKEEINDLIKKQARSPLWIF